MKIRVQLGPDEYVDDWTAFREVFEDAAEQLDLTLVEIAHVSEV
jgi:hypothetical protein